LTADYLIAYKVLLTASHICFHQKSTTLACVLEVTVIHPICPKWDVYFVFSDHHVQ